MSVWLSVCAEPFLSHIYTNIQTSAEREQHSHVDVGTQTDIEIERKTEIYETVGTSISSRSSLDGVPHKSKIFLIRSSSVYLV